MKCPICLSRRTSLFHNRVWGLKNGRVFQCQNCEVVFISRFMNDLEEGKFYQDYKRHIKTRTALSSANISNLHSISKEAAAERYKYISRFFMSRDSVLEVGASTGAFLELLMKKKDIGNLFLIEPCPDSLEYCKRFTNNTYKDFSQVDEEKKFDKIVLFHVFEHFRDPIKFLKYCHNHLKASGLLLMELPIIDDPLISLYECKNFKNFYFQKMHPYVYSIKSLRYVLTKSGFSEKKIIYYQRYDLNNHT